MIFSDIWAAIDLHTGPVGIESIPLLSAFGRIAALSISTVHDVPPFDISALDGYAINGKGSAFAVKGILEPFAAPPGHVDEGTAFFVPTGGRLPPSCRFVAREHVQEKEGVITVETGEDQRRLVKAGDWLRKGTDIVAEGDRVSPSVMASLSLACFETIEVFRKPAVSVITTGSELKQGRLVDSNRFLLAGLVERDGGELSEFHVADDSEEGIITVLSALRHSDLVILTGGTSKGKKDLTKKAVARWGGSFYLESPAVLPGKTMALGRKDRTAVCILPGNPKAVLTCYEVFVKRILRRLAGRTWDAKEFELLLPEEIRKTGDAITLTPPLLETRVTGLQELRCREPDAFVVMEGNTRSLPRGSKVRVIAP
jgi:molybdenum cofactor synthesis domain-containing protein